MSKKSFKLSALALLFVMLAGSVSVLAGANYYKGFTFNFAYAITGTTEFELDNCATTARGTANTYEYAPDDNGDYIVVSGKEDYMFTLNGSGLFGKNYATDYMSADGQTYSYAFSEVKAGTYTVDVDSKVKLGSMNRRIKGNGSIEQ